MNKFFATGFVAVALAAAANAQAQVVVTDPVPTASPMFSGGLAVKSQYVLGDLLVGTDKPVVQGWASFKLGEQCSLEVWGSHGFSTQAGAELDGGGKCHAKIGDKTEVELSVLRYVLHGTSDMTDVTTMLRHGPLDVKVSRYLWDNNPDATQFEVGYTLEPSEHISVRGLVTYETGFGLPDIVVGGAEVSYALTKRLSLIGAIYAPLYQGSGYQRSTQAVLGLEFNF